VLVRPGADRAEAVALVLAAAQDLVRAGSAGAVALPFVDPGDEPLRAALTRAGFRSGVLTAMTSLDLAQLPTFDAFVAALPKRLRRRFRREAKDLSDAGLTLSAARLPDVLARVVELEAATTTEHGGSPDLTRLTATRTAMTEILGDSVHTLVVRRGDRIVACGIDLTDEHTYYGLLYGCDYAEEQRATAYQCVCFHGPLRHAVEHGLDQVRYGFEAFVPKLIRGATLVPRETWIWLPDSNRLPALARLLDFLDERTRRYLSQLPIHRP
jgi:predicted N-acyltransferase